LHDAALGSGVKLAKRAHPQTRYPGEGRDLAGAKEGEGEIPAFAGMTMK
jgi:hypothetical protein